MTLTDLVPAGEVGTSACAVPHGDQGGTTTPARREPDRSLSGARQGSAGAQATADADGWCEHGGDADICPPCHRRYPIVAGPLPRRAIVTHRPGRVEPVPTGDRITPTERDAAETGHVPFYDQAVGC